MSTVTDAVFLTELLNEKFSDVYVYTTRCEFVDRVHGLVPHMIQKNSWQYDLAFKNIANSGYITIKEKVDFIERPIRVCVNTPELSDEAYMRAAELIDEAIKRFGGIPLARVVEMSEPITLSFKDIEHIVPSR